jgi:anti-anti-sigma factor
MIGIADMVEYIKDEESLKCIFSGRINTTDAESLENDLIDNIQHCGTKVVFDFANLEYVASMFLRVCVKAARVVRLGKIKVINAHEDIKHIFEITGFDKLMEIE